jgi:hypothetical protein
MNKDDWLTLAYTFIGRWYPIDHYGMSGSELVNLKTSKGKAKLVTELPSVEMVCPLQNFQKSP